MKYAAVTCTGGRPELFELCKRWVTSQSQPPEVWIVTTDTGETLHGLPPFAQHHEVGKVPDSHVTEHSTYRQANWSLCRAASLVPEGLAMVVFEDDDWYHKDHARLGMEFMERNRRHLAFPSKRVIANIPAGRWFGIQERNHSWEMCQQVSPTFLPLWREHFLPFSVISPPECQFEGLTCVEIKGVGYGLPGRTGATSRHKIDYIKTQKMPQDRGWQELRKIMGADLDLYLRLLKPKKKP